MKNVIQFYTKDQKISNYESNLSQMINYFIFICVMFKETNELIISISQMTHTKPSEITLYAQ